MTLWGERAALPCPHCSEDVGGGALLCAHDHDPICLACCRRVHPAQCPDCLGRGGDRRQLFSATGRIGYSDRFEDFTTCPTCNGTGRINQTETP